MSNTLNFDLSLMGLGIGINHKIDEQETRTETHHRTEFFAQEVTLIVNAKLELEGAIIDGKVVKIDAKEILVEDVIDTVKSKNHFMQSGIDIMINFWNGFSISPQVSFGIGGSAKKNNLVQFISSITGQDVEIVAEKVTASLNQVTGSEDLKLFTEQRIITNRPKSSLHHQAWSLTGSVGIGLDGKINPSIIPMFEQDGARTSAIISTDLLEGLSTIHDWLDKIFNQPETTPNIKQIFNDPSDKIKSTQSEDDKQKLKDEQRKRIEKLDAEIMEGPKAKEYLDQNNEAKNMPY